MPLAPRDRKAYKAIEDVLKILPLIDDLEPAEGILIDQAIECLSTARCILVRRLAQNHAPFRAIGWTHDDTKPRCTITPKRLPRAERRK